MLNRNIDFFNKGFFVKINIKKHYIKRIGIIFNNFVFIVRFIDFFTFATSTGFAINITIIRTFVTINTFNAIAALPKCSKCDNAVLVYVQTVNEIIKKFIHFLIFRSRKFYTNLSCKC